MACKGTLVGQLRLTPPREGLSIDILKSFDPDTKLRPMKDQGDRIASITVAEFRKLLGGLAPGVRVIQVMSQCFSGAFAETALEPAPGRAVGETWPR